MRKLMIVVVGLVIAVSLSASAEPARFGYCWVTTQGAYGRVDVDGRLKILGQKFDQGQCLQVRLTDGCKVWVGECYLRPSEVSLDPRQTARWEACRLNGEAKTLWGRVEEMAGSKNLPALTDRIVRDIANSGVIPGVKSASDLGPPKDAAKRLTRETINEILLKYTLLASE